MRGVIAIAGSPGSQKMTGEGAIKGSFISQNQNISTIFAGSFNFAQNLNEGGAITGNFKNQNLSGDTAILIISNPCNSLNMSMYMCDMPSRACAENQAVTYFLCQYNTSKSKKQEFKFYFTIGKFLGESNLFSKDFLFCDGTANVEKIQTKQGSIIKTI
jgi:hypothetical protein